MKTIFITGGYGFIGSSLIRILLKKNIFRIVNLDKLTYSSNLNSIPKNKINFNYKFEKTDICNKNNTGTLTF